MTPDMAFECLLVSRDATLFNVVDRILRALSIKTRVCLSYPKAIGQLERGSSDLVVIDCENDEASELLDKIWHDGGKAKPTVVVISSSGAQVRGAHIVLKKPVTLESGESAFKQAYSRMVLDFRRRARHSIMLPVSATCDDGRSTMVIVTDIGDGGVGLSTQHSLATGDVLQFRLRLRAAPRKILIRARVLWTRDYGRFGCEFVGIPPVDLMILQDWLKAKSSLKKPLVAV